MFKRFASIFLALIMVLGIFPVGALAETGAEEEWVFPETSTAVADQVMEIYFEDVLIASGNIEDGKVDITIPYISDEVIESFNADHRGRKRPRIAIQISQGLDDDSVTHYMGGLGEEIMTRVNWQETYAEEGYESMEKFLFDWYWEIDQLGTKGNDGSIYKFMLAQFTGNNKSRYLDPEYPVNDILYIQYFDANKEEVVGYEHIDLTLRMAQPAAAGYEPFSEDQMKLNDVYLNDTNCADKIGYNLFVRPGIVEIEATEEQLMAQKNNADFMGNIYTVLELEAPSANATKFILAKGAAEIVKLESVTPEDFEEVYSKENKPKITDTLGCFEDGEFYPVFGGEKTVGVAVAWLENGVVKIQNVNIVTALPEIDEGGNEGGNVNNHDKYLEEWDFVKPEQTKLEIPESLRKAATVGFNNGKAIVTIDLNKLSEADWIEAYKEVGGATTDIGIRLNVSAPVDGIDEYYDENGNGEPDRDQFINTSEQNGRFRYNQYNSPAGHGEIAQIFKEDGKVTIITSERTGQYYCKIAWYDVDGTDIEGNSVPPRYQILPYQIELKGNAQSIVFEDVLDYVDDANRITYDSKKDNVKLSASFNAKEGKIVYKYNHTGDINENTPKDILDSLFGKGDNINYQLVTKIKAPAGYKLRGGNANEIYRDLYSACGYKGVICGHSRSWDIQWEIINEEEISESTPEFITEYITVDFDPGINFMDVLWNPVTDESRIRYYTTFEEPVTKEELLAGGLTMDFANGHLHTGFDTSKKLDLKIVPDAMISVSVPNDGNNYIAYKVNASGGAEKYYNQDLAHEQDVMVRSEDFISVGDWRSRCENIVPIDSKPINGIEVWFTFGRTEHYTIIDWYTNTDEGAEPAKREYVYVSTDDYINEVTVDAEEKVDEVVTEVTPLGSDWKLTVNHFPQAGRDDAYYFEMEADGNVPEGQKTIYVPYSYLDENLTYEKAVAMGLQPKLHHYDDGHTQRELLKGELTEYGMKFTVKSFSPFVIAYDINEEVEQKVVIDEKLETVPESLREKFDSAGEMKDALEEEIFKKTEITGSEIGIKFMEITLQMKAPNGEWIEVTEENFPEEGLEVLIPYPAETSAESHKFAVAHLISSGEKLGEIEILVPEETADGLLIKVYSLSPFAVAYEEESNDGENDGTEEKPSVRPIRPVWGNGNKVTIIDGKEEAEKNPETGAPVFEISSAIAILSTAAVICFRKKK